MALFTFFAVGVMFGAVDAFASITKVNESITVSSTRMKTGLKYLPIPKKAGRQVAPVALGQTAAKTKFEANKIAQNPAPCQCTPTPPAVQQPVCCSDFDVARGKMENDAQVADYWATKERADRLQDMARERKAMEGLIQEKQKAWAAQTQLEVQQAAANAANEVMRKEHDMIQEAAAKAIASTQAQIQQKILDKTTAEAAHKVAKIVHDEQVKQASADIMPANVNALNTLAFANANVAQAASQAAYSRQQAESAINKADTAAEDAVRQGTIAHVASASAAAAQFQVDKIKQKIALSEIEASKAEEIAANDRLRLQEAEMKLREMIAMTESMRNSAVASSAQAAGTLGTAAYNAMAGVQESARQSYLAVHAAQAKAAVDIAAAGKKLPCVDIARPGLGIPSDCVEAKVEPSVALAQKAEAAAENVAKLYVEPVMDEKVEYVP